MKPTITLECCVDTLESARAACRGGATRLELCANLIIGGTTPSTALLRQIRREMDLPVHAIIRPRFGDFCYTGSEFDIMQEEIRRFRELGAQGVVFGILLPDGRLDARRMEILRREAGDLRCTLHRAFDVARDPLEALEQARAIGMTGILTSGQRPCAWEGADLLARLADRAGPVEIMAGAGVDADVVAKLWDAAGLRAFHLSGKVVEESPMTFRRPEINMGLPTLSEFERWTCSEEAVARARAVLEEKNKERRG